MQSVNGAEFSNIILLVLFAAAIVPLRSIFASLSPHKRDFNIEVLNLTNGVITSTCIIIYFNPTFCPKLRWLIWFIV